MDYIYYDLNTDHSSMEHSMEVQTKLTSKNLHIKQKWEEERRKWIITKCAYSNCLFRSSENNFKVGMDQANLL